MARDTIDVVLEELREFRKETNDRLSSLENDRAETRGITKFVKGVLSTSAVAGVVSWFMNGLHH